METTNTREENFLNCNILIEIRDYVHDTRTGKNRLL